MKHPWFGKSGWTSRHLIAMWPDLGSQILSPRTLNLEWISISMYNCLFIKYIFINLLILYSTSHTDLEIRVSVKKKDKKDKILTSIEYVLYKYSHALNHFSNSAQIVNFLFMYSSVFSVPLLSYPFLPNFLLNKMLPKFLQISHFLTLR